MGIRARTVASFIMSFALLSHVGSAMQSYQMHLKVLDLQRKTELP